MTGEEQTGGCQCGCGCACESGDELQIDRRLAAMVDHTLLKPETTPADVERICDEAVQYGFAAVCVNPAYVKLAADRLKGTPVKVAAPIGFPLGANTSIVKALETRDAIANGATEVDMVINLGAVKDGNFNLVFWDIKSVIDAAADQALVKVIIETSALTDDEKIKVCKLAKEAGADFIKTSTGYGKGGATPEDVALIRSVVGPEMGIKASTGVKSQPIALELASAGATRFGTSAGIKIATGE